MNRFLMLSLAAFLSLLPAAAAQPKKAVEKPALELKIYALTEAEPEMTAGVLGALLGDQDLVIAKARKPDEEDKTTPLWRSAVDGRTRSLLLRGSANHIAIANDVIAVLDRKPGAAMPAIKTVLAFELKHVNAGEVKAIIGNLEFENLRITTAGETLIFVSGSAEEEKAVETLIKALDVAVKEGKKSTQYKTPSIIVPPVGIAR